MRSIVISAIKGGVGKTKVAAQIGRALARQGKRVAFLDLDYFAPNLDVELNAVNTSLDGTGYGEIIPAITPEGFQFVSLGLIYLQDQAVMVGEQDAVREISQLQGQVKWNSPDFLVVDTAPTSSGVIQASLKAPSLLGTIIVTHPSQVAKADLLRSLSLMKDKRIPILGVVINQAYYVCPECGHRELTYDLRSEDIDKICADWGVEVLGIIPHSQRLDGYFDAMAGKVIEGAPILLPEERKPSRLPRRLMSWLLKTTSEK